MGMRWPFGALSLLRPAPTGPGEPFIACVGRRPAWQVRSVRHWLRPCLRARLSKARATVPVCVTVGAAIAARAKVLRRAAATATGFPRAQNQALPLAGFVDVHCHLTHTAFGSAAEQDAVVHRARQAGLSRAIVNGLEPQSNRQVLQLCERHPDILRPALGIYPADASSHAVDPEEYSAHFNGLAPPEPFDIAAELDFIEAQAASGMLVAIGEAGMDGMYGYTERLLEAQEEVLRQLCRVARRHRLPIILHSRRVEARVFKVLQQEGVELADFHCFTGKRRLALEIAAAGYCFSIPSFVVRNRQFQELCRALPRKSLLTETDAPWLAPTKGDWPNEPQHVAGAIVAMAEVREEPVELLQAQVLANYQRLFSDSVPR